MVGAGAGYASSRRRVGLQYWVITRFTDAWPPPTASNMQGWEQKPRTVIHSTFQLAFMALDLFLSLGLLVVPGKPTSFEYGPQTGRGRVFRTALATETRSIWVSSAQDLLQLDSPASFVVSKALPRVSRSVCSESL